MKNDAILWRMQMKANRTPASHGGPERYYGNEHKQLCFSCDCFRGTSVGGKSAGARSQVSLAVFHAVRWHVDE